MERPRKHLGVNPLYAALPSYVLIMGGGAVVNLGYCFIRLRRSKETFRCAPICASPARRDCKNAALAATGGIMWYLQFFFYAWGAANIPQRLAYVNWMLHMSIYVLCGGLVGLALGEWTGVGSRPVRLLWAGILVIIAAANLVGLGWRLSLLRFSCVSDTLSSSRRKRQSRVQALRNQIGAQLGYVCETQSPCMPSASSGVDVDRLIVDKERFLRPRAEFLEHMAIDRRIRLGRCRAGSSTPARRIATSQSNSRSMFSCTVSPIFERMAGKNAALLELLLPGQHRLILRRPHAGIPMVQLLDFGPAQG